MFVEFHCHSLVTLMQATSFCHIHKLQILYCLALASALYVCGGEHIHF
jgi:hypothetical protein